MGSGVFNNLGNVLGTTARVGAEIVVAFDSRPFFVTNAKGSGVERGN